MTASTTVAPPNIAQRAIQHVASLRPVAACSGTRSTTSTAGPRGARGRTLSGVLAGVPNIMLTTTGAKSGTPRTVPLVGVPVDGGDVAVIGTRWGSEHNPGWYLQPQQDPRAVVERDGERIDVTARRVTDSDEYDDIMRRADEVYVGFAKYRRRITRRERADLRPRPGSLTASIGASWGHERPDEAGVDRCR